MDTIQVQFLADYLNEMLATERTTAALYRAALFRTDEEPLRVRLREFQGDAEQHEEVIRNLIADLGGEVGRAPAGAQGVLDSMVARMAWPSEPALRQWQDLEILLGAELLCQRNWEVLEAIGEGNGDPQIQRAVRRVIHEEEKHVTRLKELVLNRAPTAVLAG